MTAFHEILFPLDIALKSAGGPQRRTDVVALGSGREERNARWAHSRRRYDAGYGVKTLRCAVAGGRVLRGAARAALRLSLARPARPFLRRAGCRGRADRPGDRHRRRHDRDVPAGQDLWRASIRPISGRSRSRWPAACASRSPAAEAAEGTAFTVDTTTGVVTFLAGHVPASGAAVTAGFLFDVPVRFDTDYLEVDLSAFAAGAIPKIPLVEIKP